MTLIGARGPLVNGEDPSIRLMITGPTVIEVNGKPVGFADVVALDELSVPGDLVDDVAQLRELLREFTAG